MLQIWTFGFVFCQLAVVFANGQNDRCGPFGRGRCKILWYCPQALDMLSEGVKPYMCGYDRDDPVVCCMSHNGHGNHNHHHEHDHDHNHNHHHNHGHDYDPDFHPHEPLKVPSFISQKKCDSYEEKVCNFHSRLHVFGIVGGVTVKPKELAFMCQEYEERICEPVRYTFQGAAVGGTPAKPKELTFMGLVGYGNKEDIDWACGCSLISETFVLSAAHCTRHPTSGFAQWVRLGELDLASQTDYSTPEDFRIIRRINHPNYNPQMVYNDIALFEIENGVQRFTSFIQPICLPRRESFENVEKVQAAGWGATDIVGPRSTKLLKVDLDYYNLDQCQETASDRMQIPQGLDAKTQICAGSLEGGRDTCLGDSGGPLFLPKNPVMKSCSLFTQLGITSFGRSCAVKGLPGIYTNVLHYVPWIESIVWSKNTSVPGLVWTP